MTKKDKKSVKKKVKKKVAKKEDPVKEVSRIKIKAHFLQERILTEACDEARDLYAQSRYGTVLSDGRVQMSLIEGYYLMEKGRLIIVDGRGKDLTSTSYMRKANKVEPNFWTKYCVYKDIRNRGYIIKTALKFGADFRVYDRGVKPGEDHARWVVFPVAEGSTLTWQEFAAKNRVAHSTKKRLMMGIVDEETDVTYYEIRWMRP
ncbi:MAG: tRNA-intron lyase [Nanoarchaeota archaeon]|nr:tRNA-intron lyase [Nanoarchaeota archaeon]